MAECPTRFRPDALEARLAALDAMPRTLWLPAIVNNEGDPFDRIAWVAAARETLLAGRSPLGVDAAPAATGADAASVVHPPTAPSAGMPADLAAAFAVPFAALDLPTLCRGQPAVAEQVLRSLMWHGDQVARLCAAMPRPVALERVAAAYRAEWVERGETLHEVMRLVQSLDGVVNFARWSELQGLLRSSPWQRILEARELIERMPRLAALIRRLGRVRPSDEVRIEPEEASAGEGAEQWVRRLRELALPGAPVEVDGVRRSGDPARMVPAEAAWRAPRADAGRQRRLRRLFAAKLAEHALLGWQHREHWAEPAWERAPGSPRAPREAIRPVLEAGPIVVCVDTSASMAGGPERVAKAIVVQALRTAAAERRACWVYAFSGARQVAEFELSADLDGLQRLADLVSASFHGGTDVVEPIERALARVRGDGWRQADLLIASDGEFGPTPATVAAVDAARRELGLRVHGVLIGDRETRGMRSIVDDTFWVRDWRRYGARHGQVDSPVHDRNLTGLYFPNMAAAPGTGTPMPGMTPDASGARADG